MPPCRVCRVCRASWELPTATKKNNLLFWKFVLLLLFLLGYIIFETSMQTMQEPLQKIMAFLPESRDVEMPIMTFACRDAAYAHASMWQQGAGQEVCESVRHAPWVRCASRGSHMRPGRGTRSGSVVMTSQRSVDQRDRCETLRFIVNSGVIQIW